MRYEIEKNLVNGVLFDCICLVDPVILYGIWGRTIVRKMYLMKIYCYVFDQQQDKTTSLSIKKKRI